MAIIIEYGGATESCSCPDFEFHGHDTPCKHLLALGVLGAKKRRAVLACDTCAAPTSRRELVEVHPEHESFSAYFEGERLCRGCASHAGV